MSYESATCTNYSQNSCRSCSLFGVNPESRVPSKAAMLTEVFTAAGIDEYLIKPFWMPKEPLGTRYKVKAAIGGDLQIPVIGFVDDTRTVRPLTDCPILHSKLNDFLGGLRVIVTRYGLTPYDIESRRGELKYVIATLNADGTAGIVRFVTRSSECHPRIKKAVPAILEQHPWIKVVTTNIQAIPAAVLDGPEDESLTAETDIQSDLGIFSCHFGPRSFMQVTPETARALYSFAREDAAIHKPSRSLDLYCGVGGFSFAVAPHSQSVLGIEISEDAIACARKGALQNNLSNCSFEAGDVVSHLGRIAEFSPDYLIVNPPRAGLRKPALTLIDKIQPNRVFYSSCNPKTFLADFEVLSSKYAIEEVRPFDMFPMTEHLEVAVVMSRCK